MFQKITTIKLCYIYGSNKSRKQPEKQQRKMFIKFQNKSDNIKTYGTMMFFVDYYASQLYMSCNSLKVQLCHEVYKANNKGWQQNYWNTLWVFRNIKDSTQFGSLAHVLDGHNQLWNPPNCLNWIDEHYPIA